MKVNDQKSQSVGKVLKNGGFRKRTDRCCTIQIELCIFDRDLLHNRGTTSDFYWNNISVIWLMFLPPGGNLIKFWRENSNI